MAPGDLLSPLDDQKILFLAPNSYKVMYAGCLGSQGFRGHGLTTTKVNRSVSHITLAGEHWTGLIYQLRLNVAIYHEHSTEDF